MQEALVWRTLALHPDLKRSLPELAGLLGSELPLSGIVVYLIDVQKMQPHLIAEYTQKMSTPSEGPTWRWTEAQVAELLIWHRARGVTRLPPGKPALFFPDLGEREALCVPLHSEGLDPAALILLGSRGGFGAAQETIAAKLGEPIAQALLTDRRFHEVNLLRQTLEADKQALLTRLDRQDIVEVVVGADAGLAQVMDKVEKVARTDAPVLIFGETGAGKEVVARAIHARSRRCNGPMVRVNCGAIPPGLVDSELFGHERGSFTGATATRSGWFERSDGGTLFLDEVGELPLEAQVRLLRVLQEGVLERVGGHKPIRVDVRIVAATHRPLEEMARRGEFREDLWYRLSVFPLYLPPLRERPHDIPELAAHFAGRAGRRLGGAALLPSPEDIELLLAYEWPGNVRELAAVIERAAILGNGKRLDLAKALGARAQKPPSKPELVGPADPQPFPTLDEAMGRHIEHALARTLGRIEGRGGAAELLGINPHTLRSRMRKLGLDWRRYRTQGSEALSRADLSSRHRAP